MSVLMTHKILLNIYLIQCASEIPKLII